MIIKDLYLGRQQIACIYRNGKVIWEGGMLCTAGQLIAALSGYAMAEVDTPVAIQMAASASAEGTARPNASDVVSGLTAGGELSGVAMPQLADTVNRAGKAAMALAMCARPTAGAMVYGRGQTGGTLTMSGRPQPADTVDRVSGIMSAALTMQADPEAQGMTNILAAAKGEFSGVALPKGRATAQIAMGASGKLTASARVGTWIEPYIDGEGYLVIRQAYDTKIVDGYLEVT